MRCTETITKGQMPMSTFSPQSQLDAYVALLCPIGDWSGVVVVSYNVALEGKYDKSVWKLNQR